VSRLWPRLAAFFHRERLDRELDEEMRFHLEMKAQELGDAERARRAFGNPLWLRERSREMWGWSWLEMVGQDFKFAIRTLRKNPGFTATAVLTLALGIGANTAMFSVIYAVLLRPLPYPEPGRLVRVAQKGTNAEVTIAEYEFWKAHSAAFSSVAGQRGVAERRLISRTGQEWIRAMTVTADFLRTLGVQAALGREFSAEETRAGGPQAILLTDSLWRRSMGADPEVLGRVIRLDDTSYTIVGVLPPGFWFPQSADALVPLRPTGNLSDQGTNTQMIARLKAGLSLPQAQAEMATVTEGFRWANAGRVARDYRGLMVTPYQDWLVGDVRLNLSLLFGATGLLLLIACSNLASLLLTRLAGRTKEIAVRLSLGSSRGRLLRQFLVENLVLAALGMLVGLVAAHSLLGGLVALIPFDLPASVPIRVDRAVLAFTLAVALGTGFAFTCVPFFSAARLNLHEALKAASRSAGSGTARRRTRNFLVVSEVALSATLLIAAGLMIRTLYHLRQEPLGFTTRGLLTFETPLAAKRRSPAAFQVFVSGMTDRLQAVPGVRGVAATNLLPLTGWANLPTQRDGHPDQSIGGMEVRLVTPAFFELMGISLRRGRSFHNDTAASPPVAIVNETVARRWWPQAQALGDRIVIGRFRGRTFMNDAPREVVGIVADTKTSFLRDPPRPTVFIPAAQATEEVGLGPGTLAWLVRAEGSAGIAGEIRRAIAEVDSGQRVRRLRTMDAIVASTTATSRFDAWLFGVFAGLALALAAIGVYGLLSFSVAQRRQEIGTRMALGASRAEVLRLVLKQGVGLSVIGLGLGLAGALFLGRWLSSLLYGVRPSDPSTFVAVSLLLLCAGLVASYLPARRATQIEPMEALRYE
jgi:predicted permease